METSSPRQVHIDQDSRFTASGGRTTDKSSTNDDRNLDWGWRIESFDLRDPVTTKLSNLGPDEVDQRFTAPLAQK